MTRKEITGKRSLKFSQWIRDNLPDPAKGTGFCVSNQDWIFWNWKTRRLILAEEKTNAGIEGCGELSTWFKRFITEILHPALEEYCKKNGIDYRGYHLIRFENTYPKDGKILWKNNCMGEEEEITEEELIKRLGMEDEKENK